MKKNKQTSLSLFLVLLFICSSYSTFLYSSKKNIKKNILFIKRKREERETKKMPIIDHPNKKQKHYSNNISNGNISNDNSSDKDEIGDFLHLPQSTENRSLFVPLDPNNKNRIEKKDKKQTLSPNNRSNNKLDNKSNDKSSNRDKSNKDEICTLLGLSKKIKSRQLFIEIVKKLDPYNTKRIKKTKTINNLTIHHVLYLTGNKDIRTKEEFYEKILSILKNKSQFDIRKRLLNELKLPLDSRNQTLLLKLQDTFNNPEATYFYQLTKNPSLNKKTPRKTIYKNIFQRLQNEKSKEDSSEYYEDSSE